MNALLLYFILILLIALFTFFYIRRRPTTGLKHQTTQPPLTKKIDLSFGFIRTYSKKALKQKSETPPVLFLHGLGSSLESWHPVMSEVSDRDVYALDLPGFGESIKSKDYDYGLDAQAERVLEYIYSLKLKTLDIAGCSMGGAIALWLKQKHPNLIRKLVLVSPAVYPKLAPVPSRLLTKSFFLDTTNKFSKLKSKVLSVALHRGLAHPNKVTKEMLERYERYYSDHNAILCFFKSLDLIRDKRVYENLSTLSPHSLLLWGKADIVVRKYAFQKINRKGQFNNVHIHPTGGHHLMEDDPLWVLEHLKKFTAR